MAIRVYEVAKGLGITNKELLAHLKAEGFDITTHMAAVPPEAMLIIEKKYKKGETPKPAEKNVSAAPIVDVKKEKNNKPVEIKPEKKKMENQQSASSRVSIETPKEEEKFLELTPMTLGDFAVFAKKPASEIILFLLKQGIIATKNQLLSEKNIAHLAELYNIKTQAPKAIVQSVAKKESVAREGEYIERLPIVVVIGHVDHGKTTLLDFVRKTRVAAKEKGGITQHLGAYEVGTKQGSIVFLDTPGHEAFSMMRVRGIKVADIAILMVAADDGVMPQTIEAIKHAKAVGLPIIVAMNKIDKVGPSQVEALKQQLSKQGLVPEEWGGDTVCMPISAKIGTGVDELLEVIALQAQLLELKSNISINARGYILESKLEKGRGPVATVVCHDGVLHVGDYFKSGIITGRISSMVDSYGKRVVKAAPSHPVQVAGFSELPVPGEEFEVIRQEEVRKVKSREDLKSTPNFKSTAIAGKESINIILKTDNVSSKEALVSSIEKISSKKEKGVSIINAAIGNISEGDVLLAADTDSTIYALHVKAEANAIALAQKAKVAIKNFDIIYKLLEELEAVLEAGKPVKMETKKIGELVVLKVFDIKDLGIIAGSQVKSGRITRDSKVVIWRGKQKVGEGKVKSLQRERRAVKEVHAGFECGFMVEGFNDWQVDDRVESFAEVPII